MNLIFETGRLRLREFNPADAGFIIELLNSPGWIRYIGDRNVKTEEQAIAYLENGPMKSYRVNGYGLSCVERKEDNKAIGMCGIIRRDTLDHPDIGFALLPGYDGQGYAYEIASATLHHARHVLGIPEISAITIPDNERSIRLLEKIGLKFKQPVVMPSSEEQLLLFSDQD